MTLRASLGRAMRAAAIAVPMALLAACGGGGGSSEPSSSFSLSTHELSFAAPRAALAAAPVPETVTATVNGVYSGTLYIRVEVAGDAVTVRDIVVTGTTTGRATIYPAKPETMGPGVHKATVTIHACTTGPERETGSPISHPRQ